MAKAQAKEKEKKEKAAQASSKPAPGGGGKRRQALERWLKMSEEELLTEAKNSRQELFNLRLRQQTGSVEKPSRLRDLRKEIARIETILSARKVQAAAAK